MLKRHPDENAYFNRICDLEQIVTKDEQYRLINDDLKTVFKKIQALLPEDKQNLASEAEDCFTELLMLYEEYFYKYGYSDGIRILYAAVEGL